MITASIILSPALYPQPPMITFTSTTMTTVPVIKKRARPQARVREISVEKDDKSQSEGEEQSLGCVQLS